MLGQKVWCQSSFKSVAVQETQPFAKCRRQTSFCLPRPAVVVFIWPHCRSMSSCVHKLYVTNIDLKATDSRWLLSSSSSCNTRVMVGDVLGAFSGYGAFSVELRPRQSNFESRVGFVWY